MGYTHYWKRRKSYAPRAFEAFAKDCSRIVSSAGRLGITLAGGCGDLLPIVDRQSVSFNGLANCGHEERSLGITWPAKGARGVSFTHSRGSEEPAQPTQLLAALQGVGWQGAHIQAEGSSGRDASQDSDVGSQWFAGQELRSRTCGGDCSHESFDFPRRLARGDEPIEEVAYIDAQGKPVPNDPREVGLYFQFCKTAYKPYDLIVTACLIAAKHHFKDCIIVSSDGDGEQWQEGKIMCEALLGYGYDFRLDDDEDA